MEVKMQRITVALQEWLIKRIDEVAREMGLTRAVTIRLLIMAGLNELRLGRQQENAQGQKQIIFRSGREIR